MEAQDMPDGGPGKGRVVMLVDNKVEGDSRVQKAAESMAAAGWDVTLLGLVRSGNGRSWKLGDAQVRLLQLKTPWPNGTPSVTAPCCVGRWRTRRVPSGPTGGSG